MLPQDGLNSGPCAVRISDEKIFYGADKSYILNVGSMTFEETADEIPYGSYQAICGLATKSTGSKAFGRGNWPSFSEF